MSINKYTNPILPGSNPDPSIIRHGQDYFLITSSFEYFPGIPIYHSKDLINWELISHVLTRPSQLNIRTPEPGGGIWAATIREHDGCFYVSSACFNRYRPQQDERVWPRGFYVKCNVEDIWHKDGKGWSECVYFDEVGFDQDLFFDDDGTVYLSSTRRMQTRTNVSPPIKDFAIHISKIDLPTGFSLSTPVVIRSSTSGVAEGSHIFKRGKFYYLFTAEGGTESGHCEWVSRSEKGPLGPWEIGEGPLWKNGDEVVNTGHVDIVEGVDGNWWAVMLGVRPLPTGAKTSVFGRETFLVPMVWENDWPIINSGDSIKLESQGPGIAHKKPDEVWRDGFDRADSTLELGWYQKNTPQKRHYVMLQDTFHLRLLGSPYTLSTPACPTLLLRKQTLRQCSWRTKLNFHPMSPRVEAGIVVYWNYTTYSSMGIRQSPADPTKRIIKVTLADGREKSMHIPDGAVNLAINCNPDNYSFAYCEAETSEDGADPFVRMMWMGEISVGTMTRDPVVGAAFTGMMLGLYAFGESEPCLTPADFEYAEITS